MNGQIPGHVSLFDKASYSKISRRLETARFANICLIALKFDRHQDSTAADVTVKLQSDALIYVANLVA